MAGLRWSPALTSLAFLAAGAQGQGVVNVGPPAGPRPDVVQDGYSGYYRYKAPKMPFPAAGIFSPGGLLASPYYAGFGGTRFTMIYSAPQVVAVPLVLAPPPAGPPEETPPRRIPERRPEREDPAPELPPPAPQLPGQNAGVFRPIEPDNRERARRPVEPEPAPEPAKPAVPEPPRQSAMPEPLPGTSLIDRGRAAFAAGEYGRGADIFRRAATADPADPLPPFLLTQTLVAMGKYTAAAETARAAAERFPDWPTRPFRPRDLYGSRAADYSADLERLATTRASLPDDPVLLFLSAHVLWFDGRKDEARALFRRAAAAFPAACERFLRLPATVL